MSVVAITGYKNYELGISKNNDPAISYIKMAIKKNYFLLLKKDMNWVLISGQLGIEMWAAEVVFDLQLEHPDLKLAILTPFLNQEKNWNETNKEYYETICMQSDFVESISQKEYESPEQFRQKNILFIEKSNASIVVYDTERDGSPKFYMDLVKRYQEKHEYECRMITFHDLQLIVEEEQEKTRDFY
ncbi:hypothetical protein Q75_08385 [Bacillus coahuilensis p1.1.43]|uniref:UPF0398 protein Q75_08385 n=1 Tax=Bacillus coahuilensis p1.1.43 TaxID=1150625 RepID=A0A147K8K4_9BACI|nr:DUF1273 domain-containing protein [Bacillus coahuilensis]KUP06532.1 hypothetical protein Q75_08385 [Bacillus coahuilensis p1.1.43]